MSLKTIETTGKENESKYRSGRDTVLMDERYGHCMRLKKVLLEKMGT